MKNCILWPVAITLLGLAADVSHAQVYKHVQDDGTIVYSDQKPTEDAEPIDAELPTITVVEPLVSVDAPAPEADAEEAANEALERYYRKLKISSPTPDQTIWNTGYVLTARVTNDELPLQSGHQLRFMLDGVTQSEGREMSLQLSEVYRGEHEIQVMVVDADGEVVAKTEPVTFHMKQRSIRN